VTSITQRLSVADGTEILVRRWRPAGEPWAFVLLVHGIAEHSGRYEHVGARLAKAGLDVTAYDQRGFGASGGRRAFVETWTTVHDDLAEQLASVRAHANGRPVAMYGHSLGGLIALGYVLTGRSRPDFLVLSAPAIEAAIPAWKRAVAKLLARVAPKATVRNALDGADLSRDPAVAEAYFADPLNCHTTTTRFAAEALAEQSRVRSGLSRLSVPTLVIHGDADRIVPVAASVGLEPAAGVTRRIYPDHRHELHNEPDGAAIIDDVVAWLRHEVAVRSSG
jgi:alpha-beta hydrolase superfamily lysophospholipase